MKSLLEMNLIVWRFDFIDIVQMGMFAGGITVSENDVSHHRLMLGSFFFGLDGRGQLLDFQNSIIAINAHSASSFHFFLRRLFGHLWLSSELFWF